MRSRALLLIAVAACGDNAPGRHMLDADLGCTATFAGNFAERSTTDQCAMVMPGGSGSGSSDAMLGLTIPSMMLPPSVTITIDLGATPSPGTYSSETVTSWTARGVEQIGNGVCLYSAGTSSIPTGSFQLELASIAGHGKLSATLYVLAFPGTDCGTGDIETIALDF